MKGALRIAGRVTFGLGVAAGSVALAATPAFAASGSLSVNPNGTVTSAGTIQISGHYNNSTSAAGASMTLSVDRPDGPRYTLWTGSARALSSGNTPTQTIDTSNPPWSSSEAVNGTYTVNFSVGSASASPVEVTLRVPPAVVSGFSGTASGTVAHFSWAPGSEPDLAGYDIVDVSDGARRDLTPGGIGASTCSSGCSVDIDFGSSAAGSTRNFVIDALRYTSPAHSSTVASSDSSPAAVTFPAPSTPTPSPSSTPATGGAHGGGGSSSGGQGSGGQVSGGRTSGGSVGSGGSRGHTSPGSISLSHPSAALRAYLPTTTAGAAPDLPAVVTEVQPLPQGTYKPTLAYPDQVISETVHKPGTTAISTVSTDIARVLDVGALWKSLAGAVLVLLVAGHLRAWLQAAEQLDR